MLHCVDSEIEAIEYAYNQGWTDGLPVVLPTQDRVDEVLSRWGYDAGEEVGRVPERHRIITAEMVAANLVMAGGIPDMFPVILASVEAILSARCLPMSSCPQRWSPVTRPSIYISKLIIDTRKSI